MFRVEIIIFIALQRYTKTFLNSAFILYTAGTIKATVLELEREEGVFAQKSFPQCYRENMLNHQHSWKTFKMAAVRSLKIHHMWAIFIVKAYFDKV